jgi:hypothetical protein
MYKTLETWLAGSKNIFNVSSENALLLGFVAP